MRSTPIKPFAIIAESGAVAQRFACYRSAEQAAIKYCREKSVSVPVRHRGRLAATIIPNGANRPHIDLTGVGAQFA